MSNIIHIRNANLVDPSDGTSGIGSVTIADGIIHEASADSSGAEVIDARGLTLTPGFIDVHVHLREPGKEEAETVCSGLKAAARGGFTTVVSMPNTTPATDGPGIVSETIARASAAGSSRVLPSGCLTVGRLGAVVADLAGMAEAGATAFTDDGSTVADTEIMRSAMEAAAALNIPVMDHALDHELSAGGVMHHGIWSEEWGLPGIPAEAEASIVMRDIALARETGCRMHIQHLSARESIALIRDAKAAGIPITCEVTPHHLYYTDEAVEPEHGIFKMSPPLRSAEDRDALRAAVAEGVIDVFATDHAPHTEEENSRPCLEAPFGVVGLETAVGVTYTTMVKSGMLGLMEWVRAWTVRPARILGKPLPSLAPGSRADLVLLDLEEEWTVDSGRFVSRSTNTPFDGERLTGCAVCTLVDGKLVWDGRADG